MSIDIYHSRRTNYAECMYWVRDQRDSVADASKWILTNKPTGIFYAKEESPQYNQFNTPMNQWAFNKTGITLKTSDDINNLTIGSIVQYQGKAWFVDDIQKKLHRKESEFDVEEHYDYYINIRR